MPAPCYRAATFRDSTPLRNTFRALDLDRLKTTMRSPVMVDLRNVYRPEDLRAKGFTYVSIGRA